MTTPLRQKMIEDMQLRGLAVRTQESYLLAVRQLARHYQKSPDQISEDELRQYFLFLMNEKHAAHSTCTINLCGIKFFYEHTLGRQWYFLEFVRPAKEKKLPVVLSVQEVAAVNMVTDGQPGASFWRLANGFRRSTPCPTPASSNMAGWPWSCCV